MTMLRAWCVGTLFLATYASALLLPTPVSRASVLRGAFGACAAAAAALAAPRAARAFALPPLEAFDDPRIRAEFAQRGNPPLSSQHGGAFWAITIGDTRLLKQMVDAGWDLERATDSAGKGSMHRAAQVGDEGAIQILLDAGLKIDPVTQFKETPLHMAARNNKLGAVKKLVEAGASTTKINYNDDNALGIARRYKYAALTDYLAGLK